MGRHVDNIPAVDVTRQDAASYGEHRIPAGFVWLPAASRFPVHSTVRGTTVAEVETADEPEITGVPR